MVSIEFREAATEVLEILDNTNKEDVEKIPKQFVDFLTQVSSKNYKPIIDYSKPIEEMNLKKKTIDILAVICSKYWCIGFDKFEFINMLESNEKIQLKNLAENYYTGTIFNGNTTDNTEKDLILLDDNKNFFTKIINIIKNKLKNNN